MPASAALDNGELVRIKHFYEVRQGAPAEGIGTDRQGPPRAYHIVYRLLIAQHSPQAGVTPQGRIARGPEARITVSQGPFLFPHALPKHRVDIETPLSGIPLDVGNYLQLPPAFILRQAGDSPGQCVFGGLGGQRGGGDPQAELVIFQAGGEIRDQDIKEVGPGFIELADMRTPGERAKKRATRVAQRDFNVLLPPGPARHAAPRGASIFFISFHNAVFLPLKTRSQG